MAFKDDLLTVLSGGLPLLIDGGTPTPTPQPQPVEAIPPEPQLQDTEPFILASGLTSKNILLGTAAVVGLLGILFLVRK